MDASAVSWSTTARPASQADSGLLSSEARKPGEPSSARTAAANGIASTSRALAEVERRHPGVLAAELRRAAATIALGSPAETALATLERRCPTAGVPPLVAALRRASRLGASPADTLEAQAADARARSAHRREEAAARAAPKIQLVIALALVPSVMLLVAAALVPALTGR